MTRRAIRDSHPQSGSAYLLAMLILVVSTLVALSLATFTDTERLIGVNERTTQRVFYAAETGLAISAARVLVSADHAAQELLMEETGTTEALEIGNRLELAPAVPIQFAPCNLCEINNTDTATENAFLHVDHGLTATATRVHVPTEQELARSVVAETLGLEPWRNPVEVLLATFNSPEIGKVKI